MRTALVAALSACAEERLQRKARRFLQGLSCDELQYIAEFLGSCVLESSGRTQCRRPLADGITQFARSRPAPAGCLNDQEHKMILLLEYLRRCKLRGYSLPLGAGYPS